MNNAPEIIEAFNGIDPLHLLVLLVAALFFFQTPRGQALRGKITGRNPPPPAPHNPIVDSVAREKLTDHERKCEQRYGEIKAEFAAVKESMSAMQKTLGNIEDRVWEIIAPKK